MLAQLGRAGIVRVMDTTWDCIVVGGGAAGLSAALVLGRARRRTLVIDGGRPSNAVAHGIGGLLGQDGRPPAELYADGRAELAAYPTVEVRGGEVVRGERDGDEFVLDARRRRRRDGATGAAGDRHGLPPPGPAGHRASGGAGRSSTARSATGGRSGSVPWACSSGGRPGRTAPCC